MRHPFTVGPDRRPGLRARTAIGALGLIAIVALAACGGGSVHGSGTTATAVTGTGASVDPGGVTSSAASSVSASALAPLPSPVNAAPTPGSASSAPATSAAPVGQGLPLGASTGSASQVITVVAASTSSTTATLQAWDKAADGWLPHGAAVTAHLGSAGMTTHPSESVSATPIGSFALSRSFGALANPGTGLTYHQTSSADWWISQPGSLYNTMQTCSGSCPFTQGDPNEHLAAIRPQYNYAVVIEYNTSPVVQGAGSAFFLHVTDGGPTAGCVSIPQDNLVAIMQWLKPADSPRILIGLR